MEILRLHGTHPKLYELVAPLVMNPAVLRQNNNYPFKTGFNYEWWVALDSLGEVVGFVPVKCSSGGWYVDNYYVKGDEQHVLELILQQVVDASDRRISALVHKRHAALFEMKGFTISRQLKNYNKMEYGIPA